jgi:hypothetical protein
MSRINGNGVRRKKIFLVVFFVLGIFLLGCCDPPGNTTLGVNLIPQHRDWWCWAACTEMISQYYGHRVEQCLSAKFVHDNLPDCCTGCSGKCPGWGNAWGASTANIKDNWTHWKFDYHYKAASLDWNTIKKTIGNSKNCWKSPIYVIWKWNGDGGHVVTSYGYIEKGDKKYVYYRDPWPVDCKKDDQDNCHPINGGSNVVSTFEYFIDNEFKKWSHSFYHFKYIGP